MAVKATGRVSKQDMKQDQFVSWVFFLIEKLRNNSRLVIGTVAGVVAVVIIVVLISQGRQSARREVNSLFGRAAVEARSQNPSLAIIDYRKIVDEHSGSPLAGQACYNLANSYYTQRDFNEAEILFQRYLDDFGDDQLLVIAAHWGIAGCLEQKGEFAAASDRYRTAAELDLESILAGDLIFAAVRTACEANDRERALQAYDLAEKNFGDQARVVEPVKQFLYEWKFLDPPIK